MDFPHPPPAMRAAIDALVAAHPVFAGIEQAAGPLPWRTRPRGFPGLLQAIIGQQISNHAARAIWARLAALPAALEPGGLLALEDAALGTAGLSRPKMAHARALATAFASGTLDDAALATLPDDEALATITSIRGLGPWTAEVYLLFAQARMDVFPAGDVAIAASAQHLLALPHPPGTEGAPPPRRALAPPARPRRPPPLAPLAPPDRPPEL